MRVCATAMVCVSVLVAPACDRGAGDAPATEADSATATTAAPPPMPEECGPMGVAGPSTAPAARVEDQLLSTDSYTLSISATPAEVSSGDLFSLRVNGSHAQDEAGRTIDDRISLTVTAAMPEHEHGMDTVSRVRREGGDFIVEGMLLQMPGRWEVYFDLTDRGVTERAVLELNVR